MNLQKFKEIMTTEIGGSKKSPIEPKMDKKFHVLRLTVFLYVVLAFCTVIFGVVIVSEINRVSASSQAALPFIIGISASVITIMAIAEGIQVFLAIEENTRAMKEHFIGKDHK